MELNKIGQDLLQKAYRPYDIVDDMRGSVGFIQEVDLNDSQDNPRHQLSYAVCWLAGKNTKHAWFEHEELRFHCNLFEMIAKASSHPFGNGERSVDILRDVIRVHGNAGR